MKIFNSEFFKFYNLIREGKNFAFSKFADGEWNALLGNDVNNGEFESSKYHIKQRALLLKALRFQNPNYYVGISCSCCQGSDHEKMKFSSGQKENNLTFANLWVNSNYELTKNLLFDLIGTKKVVLFANEKSTIHTLPFHIEKWFKISNNAWVKDLSILETFPIYEYKDFLFLFAAGPFGNICIHKFWCSNEHNTYLDIGSALNPFLNSAGFERGYFKGQNAAKFCIWN